jgi:hypothetical protein
LTQRWRDSRDAIHFLRDRARYNTPAIPAIGNANRIAKGISLNK